MVALLLIRHVRLSGEEGPHDDSQNDDDEEETTGSTAGLPASVGLARMLRTCRPMRGARRRLAIRQRLRSESTKTI